MYAAGNPHLGASCPADGSAGLAPQFGSARSVGSLCGPASVWLGSVGAGRCWGHGSRFSLTLRVPFPCPHRRTPFRGSETARTGVAMKLGTTCRINSGDWWRVPSRSAF